MTPFELMVTSMKLLMPLKWAMYHLCFPWCVGTVQSLCMASCSDGFGVLDMLLRTRVSWLFPVLLNPAIIHEYFIICGQSVIWYPLFSFFVLLFFQDLFLSFLNYTCIWVSMCTHKCSVPMEFKRGLLVFNTWNYRLWESSTGNWARLSSRAVPCLNCWITDLALKWLLCGYFYNREDNEAYKVSIKNLFLISLVVSCVSLWIFLYKQLL